MLAACPEPDILVNNAGGPPPGDFRDWDEAAWIAALRANMLTPIELMRAVVDGMVRAASAGSSTSPPRAVKAPIAELGLSNGARAGLTGFVAGLARAVAGQGITINNILPGPSPPTGCASNLAANAKRRGLPLAEVERAAQAAVPAGRFGDAAEFGQLCAFLCSTHAGYITGQNVLIDGGAFPGTL